MLVSFRIFFFIPLLLHMYLVTAWESIDTCQMNFLEMDKDAAWKITLLSTEFNTDKSGLYDMLVRLRRQEISLESDMITTGVNNVNLDIPAESADTPQNGTVFGYSIETTNFMMNGITWFEALQTGDYTFSIEGSDAALLAVTSDMSPYCCANMNDPAVLTTLQRGLKYIIDLPSDLAHSNGTLTVNMREGVEYMLEFVYINWSGDAHFTFTVTNPDGETTSDFTGYAGQLINMECDNVHTTSRSYSEWSLDYSTTYSSTIITVDQTTTTTLETVYYVITPMPEELSVTEASSSSIISSSMTKSDITLTSLATSFVTSSLSSESIPSSSLSDDVSSSSTTSSFDEEISSLSEYPTSEEYQSSSDVSSTQDTWSSSVNSRSATSESPSIPPTNTDDAVSRSHEISTDPTSIDSSRTASQTSIQVATTSEAGSDSLSTSSLDVTSSLANTLFFGNSSSLTTGDLTTTSNIDDSSTADEADTTDVGDEYTSVTHTNTECTKSPTEDNWKITNTNQNSVLTRETSFTVITTDTSNTNDDQVNVTNKATNSLNTPTGKYEESNDKPNKNGNSGPVNTKSLAESLSNVVPDVTQAVPSTSTTSVISGYSNNPVVSVYAVETVNLGSRLCINTFSILLPLLLLI